MEIDDQNGVDPFISEMFRVIVRVDIGNVGTLHELVGVISYCECASSGNQFIELTEPGTAQLIQGKNRRLGVQSVDSDIRGTGSRKQHRKTHKDQNTACTHG